MGRRSSFAPKDAQLAVMRHYREVAGRSVNMVQYIAQQYEQDAVNMVAGFMFDMTLPVQFRRDCAKDVVTWARGSVGVWAHDGLTVDPTAIGHTGKPVADEIRAIQASTELHKRLDELVRSGAHPDTWPPDIRAIASDLIAYYEEEDKTVTVENEPVP